MPVFARNNRTQMVALKEAPGIFKDPGEIGGYWFDPQQGWKGPYSMATDAAIAKVQRELTGESPERRAE